MRKFEINKIVLFFFFVLLTHFRVVRAMAEVIANEKQLLKVSQSAELQHSDRDEGSARSNEIVLRVISVVRAIDVIER